MYNVAVSLQPIDICLGCVPRVAVGQPDSGLTPLNILLPLVFVRHVETSLSSKPLLVSWEEIKSSHDIIEDGILTFIKLFIH